MTNADAGATLRRTRLDLRIRSPWPGMRQRLLGLAAVVGVTALTDHDARAQGQYIPCAPFGLPLVKIPELVSEQGKLKKTILLKSIDQRTNLAPDPNNLNNCVPQAVRNFRGEGTVLPAYPGVAPGDGYTRPGPPSQFFADPVPGPTLRARVGDLVQLTFLNHVDQAKHADSIDRGASIAACDRSSSGDSTGVGYPESAHEAYPNCFHGSSSANIHFHGTHTNPNSTGDNVFLNVAPARRELPVRDPTVTAQTVETAFAEFFKNCELHLGHDVLSEWPHRWEDLPEAYRELQRAELEKYDAEARPEAEKLWRANQEDIAKGRFPHYFIGAFPYCFRLPAYSAGNWPPKPMHAAGRPPHAVPRQLQMGQAPGTHWYHAHKHGSTTLNVMNGMTGAFIIEGDYDDDLNRFYGSMPAQPETNPPTLVRWTRAQPVLVINELGVSPNLLGGGSGPALPVSVNGRIQPTLTMRPGEVQMWRIVNTGARGFVNLIGPPAGFEWRQLAQDGVQFTQDNYEESSNSRSFLFAPGNRVDLLVKAPASAPAGPTPVQAQGLVTRVGLTPIKPPPFTLFSIQVAGEPPADPRQSRFIPQAPPPPSFLTDITDKEITAKKVITFNSKPPRTGAQHTIDDKQYDGSVGQVVLLNKAEEWQIVNTTVRGSGLGPGFIDHPFHIHINPFQVTEVFDPNELITDPKTRLPIIDPATNKTVSRYVFDPEAKKRPDQCYINPRLKPADIKLCDSPSVQKNLVWWDVFPIPAGTIATDAKGNQMKDADGKPLVVGGYFKMRSRFVDYPGLFVIHCHILAHEDRGMMTIVEVRPLQASARHH